MTYVRVDAGLTRADIPGLCAGLADLLRGREPGAVVCDVRAVAGPDMVTVEALARLRLTARRHGCTLVIDGAGAGLLGLLDLLGLGGPLAPADASGGPLAPPGASGEPTDPLREPLGQAEQREQAPGVEEVVDARDPPA